MPRLTSLLVLVLLLLLPPVTGIARAGEEPGVERPSLAEALAQDARFTILAGALRRAGLDEVLATGGPFTVLAPTDEAFLAADPAFLRGLTGRPEVLRRVLRAHLLAGHVRADDLLATRRVETVDGGHHAVAPRIGGARVVEADMVCKNGRIHAIDRVLAPTRRAAAEVLRAAIAKGSRRFNAGDVAGCVEIYTEAAAALRDREDTSPWHQALLDEALGQPEATDRKRAWQLRGVFDGMLADLAFEPVMEAPMAQGFPAPGPVGRVVVKTYPAYRAARAKGGNAAFWTLFAHIKRNDVAMTTPVEMTVDETLRARAMAFLYERPDQGTEGSQGRVEVVDEKPAEVLSLGIRGPRTDEALRRAREILRQHLHRHGLEAAGPFRLMGYNSPMVPAARKFWELQVPIPR